MKDEIELKLILAPTAFQRLRRHPLIKAHRLGRAVTRTLDNTYYDTPERTLQNVSGSLRVRRVGAQRLQTVKVRSAKGAPAGHFTRSEWEEPLTGEAPSPESLDGTPLPALLGEAGIAALQALFTTRFRRTTYRLTETPETPETSAWEVELTFDDGAVDADGLSAPIQEVELELVRGTPGDLYRLARTLCEGQAVRLGTRTKAQQGYDLIDAATPQVTKAPPPGLTKGMTAIEALQAIGTACITHYLSAASVLHRAPVPEAIHQMRVALRRLRSAMTLFGDLTATPEGQRLKAETKWLAGELADARDLDVFLAEVLAPLKTQVPDGTGLAALEAHIESLRTAAYDRAFAAAGGARAGAYLLDLVLWLDNGDWLTAEASHVQGRTPIRHMAAKVLDRRARKVQKAGRGFKSLTAEQRHRVRIEIKKLRYALDFFGGLFKKRRVKAYRAPLAALQDSLGGLNDLAVAHTLLHDLTVGPSVPRGPGSRDMAFAAGLISGWHEAAGQPLNHQAVVAWKDFRKAPPFWR